MMAMRRVLGLMSGTALDGVDGAVIETDGQSIRAFGPTAFRPYTEAERAVLRSGLGLWPGEAPERLAAVEDVLDRAHRAVAAELGAVDLVGFHGQTLAHDPGGRGTHQAGSGARLARGLGVPVVWDFRSADMAAGGQGAPLAPFYHWALARLMRNPAPVAFLNIGGVANLTWVDPRSDAPEAPGALIAFDTGPGNALLDDFVAARTGQRFDRDGALAAAGRIDHALIAEALTHPYLARPAPKSLDRLDFHPLLAQVAGHRTEDGAATLAAFTVATVAAARGLLPGRPACWLVTGGGRRNPVMMAMLADALGGRVAPVETAGFDGDMIEAQAFAWLAARSLAGLPLSAPGTTGVARPVTGGRLARP